jgi:UDP-glucose 4-epimerase
MLAEVGRGMMTKAVDAGGACLVLGGCGFLGSVVTRRLVRSGKRVRVFDKEGVDTWRLQSVLPQIDLRFGDFMNVGDLTSALDGIDTVLHFIGTTIPQTSMNDMQFDIESNVLTTVRLLELMSTRKAQRLIFSSSGGTVYGIPQQERPLSELDPTEPIAAYGVSKLMIEKIIKLFDYNYGIPSVILRISNPFGESQHPSRPQGAVGVFLHKALRGETIPVWGDGSVVRDYIYQTDVASAVEAVLANPQVSGIYNVGTGIGHSLNQVLEVIRSTTGEPCRVAFNPARSFDVPYNVLAIDKLRDATGWTPRYSVAEGVKEFVAALQRKSL